MLEQFGNLKFALRSNVSDDNGNEDSVEEAEQSQPTRVVELSVAPELKRFSLEWNRMRVRKRSRYGGEMWLESDLTGFSDHVNPCTEVNGWQYPFHNRACAVIIQP